jgi:hypothetical protein
VDAAATPFVQGKLRNEQLSFDVESECACCKKPILFTMKHDLSYTLSDHSSDPVFFVPMVDFTRLKAPSIVERF